VAPEVGIDASGKGRYLFFFEFADKPADLKRFLEIVDDELKNQNRVYREHRAGEVAILPPAMSLLGSGSVKKIMEELGFRSVQNKFPRVVNEQRRDLIKKFLIKEQNA
jgi:hypothetical protein